MTLHQPVGPHSQLLSSARCQQAANNSYLFDTRHWHEVWALTLTLKQARRADNGSLVYTRHVEINKLYVLVHVLYAECKGAGHLRRHEQHELE